MALVVVGDLVAAHRHLVPTAPGELLAFRPPALAALGVPDRTRLYVYEYFLSPGSSRRYLGRDDPYVLGPSRGSLPRERAQVLSQRLYPFPPSAGRWGFEGSFDVDTRGFFSAELSRLVSLLREVEGTPAHTRLLQLGGVSHVIALHARGLEDLEQERVLASLFPEPIRIFRVPGPLPRTYAVGGIRVAQGRDAFEALLGEGFDPRTEVLLAEGVPRSSPGFRGQSRLLDFRPDRVRVEADLSAPGYVVLVDAYDPDWRATIDGRPEKVLRANVAFRAVSVESGRHIVEFSYRPPSVRAGLAVSGLTLAGLAVAGLRRGVRSSAAAPARDESDQDRR
jgi:hypothetical protein